MQAAGPPHNPRRDRLPAGEPPRIMPPLGNRLAEVRASRGWTQSHLLRALLARFPRCGATTSSISRWEHSKPMPALATAIMLAVVLGEPVESLFPLAEAANGK